LGADLHLHSIHSDGSYTPTELVEMAGNIGLRTIALTDHDTVAGIDEAMRAGQKKGIEVIPGIEFSTFRGKAEIHILGYYIDYRSEILKNRIEQILTKRIDRAKKMIDKLNELGIMISYQGVRKLVGDRYIGRPHIALALQQAGYIKEVGEAFSDRYIGNGGRAYIPKYQMSPDEAIKLIKQVAGVAVLAHPFFINHGEPLGREEIEEMLSSGLDGIEVYQSKHSQEVSRFYLQLAQELNLLITGGSDFHGENNPGVELGDVIIDDEFVERLRMFSKVPRN
jgi:3',5'-nucleoside bisphosphate phosphatase